MLYVEILQKVSRFDVCVCDKNPSPKCLADIAGKKTCCQKMKGLNILHRLLHFFVKRRVSRKGFKIFSASVCRFLFFLCNKTLCHYEAFLCERIPVEIID